MTPRELVTYWALGGNGHIDFGPQSVMSQIFSQGNGAHYFEDFVLLNHGTNPAAGVLVTDFAYVFTWPRAASTLNAAEHAIGGWNAGVATSTGTSVTYSVWNRMGLNSLLFGRQLEQYFGIQTVGTTAGDLTMTVTWIR